MKRFDYRLVVAIILVLVALGIIFYKKIKLGLDLAGGVHLVLMPKVDKTVTSSEKEELEGDLEDKVDRALEIIRTRVDEFGVAEPIIQKEGKDRIIVQLAGIRDIERAKKIIGKTALLEFRIVNEEVPEALTDKSKIPPGHEILKDEEGNPYLVKKTAEEGLTGKYLKNARVGISTAMGIYTYEVQLEFNREGARKFAKITGENVNKRLAIILDGKVKSAPTIRERIPGGRASISNGISFEEAKDLAIVLRAGALPVPLSIAEERLVGPSLGDDSIRKGVIATIAGVILIILFMSIYYKISGIIANLGLLSNLILLLGGLSLMDATLTLPGIAGIVLTLGMAIDANIIIFERIREELRAGRPVKAAVNTGYKKAFWTIFDSHITILITTVILYIYGTGPVRGFAVTLFWGVLISLYSAVWITKAIFDIRKESLKLSI